MNLHAVNKEKKEYTTPAMQVFDFEYTGILCGSGEGDGSDSVDVGEEEQVGSF